MDDLKGRKTFIEASGLTSGHVLDIGVGECACMSIYLAKKGFDVIGIDRSPMAVHEARKELKKKKLEGNIKIKLANAEKLPFKSDTFDAVCSYHSMHCVNRVQKTISEMFRVCKRNSRVIICDLHEDGRKAYEHEPDEKLLKQVEKYLRKYARSVRVAKTKYNMLYICKK